MTYYKLKSKSIKSLFSVLFMLIIQSALAITFDNLKFKNLTVGDGLSNGDIRCFIQDNHGFIWIGTTDGLNRFDGYNFNVYRHNREDSTSLPGSVINVMMVDSENNLWIGTNHGLCRYVSNTDMFDNSIDTYGHDGVISIAEDQEGRIWIGTTTNGLWVLDKANQNFDNVNIITDNYQFHGSVNYIIQDTNNFIWFTTNHNLIRYNSETKEAKVYSGFQYSDKEPDITESVYTAICSYNNQKIWIATWNSGLYEFDKKSESFHQLAGVDELPQINTLYTTHQGDIIIGILDGFAVYDKKTYKFKIYKKTERQKHTQLRTSVKCILVDNQENLWLGHDQLGISVSLKQKAFKSITNNNIISLTNSEVTAVLKDKKERLWVGFWCGDLNLIDQKRGTVNRIFTTNADKTSFSGTIFSVFEDSNGRIWFSSYRGGLQYYNEMTGRFEITGKAGDEGLNSNDIRDIYEDHKGRLWLATQGQGIDIYDPESQKFINVKQEPDSGLTLGSNWVFDIEEGANREVWVGTSWGITVFDTNLKILKNLTADENLPNTIIGNMINVIRKDKEHNIWVGTNEGLSMIDSGNHNIINYTTRNGLPNNVVQGILEDNKGLLWISTNNGITSFNTKIEHFINYNENDGLLGREFFPRSCNISNTGVMYFGSKQGLNYFLPEEITGNNVYPKVVLTDFQLFNKSVDIGKKYDDIVILNKNITETREVNLSYKHNVFSIEFTGLNYGSIDNTEYEYKLLGFDKPGDPFQNIGKRRYITFTNLKPGEYVFQVKAGSSDDYFPEESTELLIHINPPWWNTVIFRISLILLIVICVIGFTQLRLMIVNKRNTELETKVKERTLQLHAANLKLIERQREIANQAEELHTQKEVLQDTNQELEQQKQELKELNVTKDRFFSILAHDLKGPFNTILGFSEILVTRLNKIPKDKLQEYVEALHKSSSNVYRLLDNLLTWSRSQSNSIKYEPEDVSLKKIIDANVKLLKEVAQKKNCGLIVNITRDILVYADVNMLNTIIINLLSNSIKFTANGVVTITAQNNNQKIKVTVEDTGVGMDNNTVAKLFKIDENISNEGTDGEKGTGLGLIICKEFVEKNKGNIWVESLPGRGTKFIFTVPVARSVKK